MSQRVAFKMKLFPGYAEEYKKRHDEIPPELTSLLKSKGIKDYSIFLDDESNTLFAVLKIDDPEGLQSLPEQTVMRKWWASLTGIMETNPDNSPVTTPLREVFYLP